MNKKCMGIFSISWDLIENSPDLVKMITKDIIIIRAECIFDSKTIQYIGISEKYFDNISFGEKLPEYTFVIETKKGSRTIKYNIISEKRG